MIADTAARDAYQRRLGRRINEYLTPIDSGLEPAPPGAGELSPKRAAELDQQLRELDAARARASVDSRAYVVRGTDA
ncbi:hypothetical protein K1W54_29855 [Micromonospora sp. CPCC 205371]|nr:hypothetical protein [Micromonospora sp. CPCC 205371]